MKFTCSRCDRRFSTAEEPVPGRIYRIPCRCGNTIVLQGDSPGGRGMPPGVAGRASLGMRPPPLPKRPRPAPVPARAARPATAQLEGDLTCTDLASGHPVRLEHARDPEPAVADDPFAHASRDDERAEMPLPCALALRDPDAPSEETTEDDVAAGAPWRPSWWSAGVARLVGAGAVGGVVGAMLVLVASRPWSSPPKPAPAAIVAPTQASTPPVAQPAPEPPRRASAETRRVVPRARSATERAGVLPVMPERARPAPVERRDERPAVADVAAGEGVVDAAASRADIGPSAPEHGAASEHDGAVARAAGDAATSAGDAAADGGRDERGTSDERALRDGRPAHAALADSAVQDGEAADDGVR